jgi:hypothetical protein
VPTGSTRPITRLNDATGLTKGCDDCGAWATGDAGRTVGTAGAPPQDANTNPQIAAKPNFTLFMKNSSLTLGKYDILEL